LIKSLEEVPESVKDLLRMSRGAKDMFEGVQQQLLRRLLTDAALQQRVERLSSIDGVGEIVRSVPGGTNRHRDRNGNPNQMAPKCPCTVRNQLRWLGYQINFLSLSTRPKNRITLEVSIYMSGLSCHDGPVWPCNGALCPCICRQPPGNHQRLSK
jgi:hypothetical protein